MEKIFALKFDKRLGGSATEMPAKFQTDWETPNADLSGSIFRHILR